MLRTRLIVGTVLAALTAGMLLADRYFAPWFPFLFAVVLGLSVLGTAELVNLLPSSRRPRLAVCLAAVIVLVVLNWIPVILGDRGERIDRLGVVSQGFAAAVLFT